MFENVLVGVDERDGSRDAIALAKLLSGVGAKLTLAHVYQGDPYVYRGPHSHYDANQSERARELLERMASEAGIDASVRWQPCSTIGRGLHLLAESSGADLLVVGSSRRGLLGRVALGDDTRAALNGAPCAVAVAPAGYSREPIVMREIGVGYDGSPESEHALGIARALAAEHKAKLSACEAVTVPAYIAYGFAIEGDLVEDLVGDAIQRLSALGDVEPHAAYGNAAEELALYGASVDLLVIGSRGYGPVGRLMHGSTAQQLARTARCPLLILTRAARQAAMPAPVADDSGESAAAGR